jgi:hypothetical protein
MYHKNNAIATQAEGHLWDWGHNKILFQLLKHELKGTEDSCNFDKMQ